MTEQVQTGGLMQFRYSGQTAEDNDFERKEAIQIGYGEYDERKRKNKRNKIIFFLILLLIIFVIISYLLIKN
jgi:t-SNARE complex subunit (syntaxin)